MSHLDEGRLQALLDRELEESERQTVEAHLAGCEECRRLLAELGEFQAEADRLIGLVEPPRAPGAWGAGVVPGARPARLARWRNLAWAASLVLAAGLGWSASAVRFSRPDTAGAGAETPLADDSRTANGPAALVAPATPEESAEARSPAVPAPNAPATTGTTAGAREQDRAAASPRPTLQARAAENAAVSAEAAPEAPAADADQEAGRAEPRDRADALAERAQEPLGLAGKVAAPAAGGFAAAAPAPAPPAAAAPAEGAVASPSRLEVAQADRAPARKSRDAAAPSPGTLQAVPLEEAVRVLGGSIRLVDGMVPSGVLLGPGQDVDGADPGLPLVRLVYQDPPGRELWLDQQRRATAEADEQGLLRQQRGLLPGDTLPGRGPGGRTELRWRDQTGFLLRLTGFVPADSLRALMRRVR